MPDDSAIRAAFDRPSIILFIAVEVSLPGGGQIRLLDGSGVVSFGGRTFVGLDPQFGVLALIEPISDGMGDDAPGLRLGLNPPTASAAAILAGQEMQGRTVLVWLGSLDPSSGQVIPDPLLIFAGEVDQGVLSVGLGSRALSLECVSVWERLFEDGQGVRLSNAFHQTAWPGELGFEYMTDVTRQLPWGADTPRPQVISDALYRRP